MDPVCHFEIPYADKDRAQKFYRDVFGWEIGDVPDLSYSTVTTTPMDEQHRPTEPGAINGGMYERNEHSSSSPVVVMLVPNCQQRVEDVKAAGGALVMEPTNIANMGIYAQVRDTEDNVIGLWQALRGG